MKVFILTVRDRVRVEPLDRRIGIYASLEVAINAAEIHAEEQFGRDDVTFTFPVQYAHGDTGEMMHGQYYPPERPYCTVTDPGGPWDMAYAIEEALVQEEAV